MVDGRARRHAAKQGLRATVRCVIQQCVRKGHKGRMHIVVRHSGRNAIQVCSCHDSPGSTILDARGEESLRGLLLLGHDFLLQLLLLEQFGVVTAGLQ